jgi:hypothetical protein
MEKLKGASTKDIESVMLKAILKVANMELLVFTTMIFKQLPILVLVH